MLRALTRMGWTIKRQSGSHRILSHADRPDYVFAFHDGEEIGPRMRARIAKATGLQAGDLQTPIANHHGLRPVPVMFGEQSRALRVDGRPSTTLPMLA